MTKNNNSPSKKQKKENISSPKTADPSKILKSSLIIEKKEQKTKKSVSFSSKDIKKNTQKPKVYKKTPLKTEDDTLILHSKRQHKKTERAIESAEQAKLFQILKYRFPPNPAKTPAKKPSISTEKKKVSFNLGAVEDTKRKNSPNHTNDKKDKKPLQGIMKQTSLEDRLINIEKHIKEIFEILKKTK